MMSWLMWWGLECVCVCVCGQPAFVDMSLELVVGGGAAAIARTVVAPLSRIKILLQAWPQPRVGSVAALPPSSAAPPPLHTLSRADGWRGIVTALWQTEGLTGLWRGNGTNMLRVVPAAVLNHVLYDRTKARIASVLGLRPDAVSSLGQFLLRISAGSITVCASVTALYPLEVARTRITCDVAMTAGRRTYGGVWDCIVRTAKNEGVSALWAGLPVSLAAVVPMLAVSHATFDTLRQFAPPHPHPSSSSSSQHGADRSWVNQAVRLGIATSSAAVAQVAVYPLDTVRRRLQLDGSLALNDGILSASLDSASTASSAASSASSASSSPPVARALPGAGAKPLPAWVTSALEGSPSAAALVSEGQALASGMSHRVRDALSAVRPRLPAWLSGQAVDSFPRARRYRGAMHCARTIVETEGPLALYRGLVPQLLKSVPGAVVQLLAYDALWRACTQ